MAGWELERTLDNGRQEDGMLEVCLGFAWKALGVCEGICEKMGRKRRQMLHLSMRCQAFLSRRKVHSPQ